MSMDQIPAKEFMRRLSGIDDSLKDIAKSLSTLTKIANRHFPIGHSIPTLTEPQEEEDDDDEMS